MSNTKEMSKRQTRREQIRRKEQRGRLVVIGFVTLFAIVVGFFLIYPNVKPVAEVIKAEPQEYPQADKLALGDPEAPVKIDVYEDFQCPACRNFTNDIEPLIIENLIATGKVYYVFHNYPFLDGDGAGTNGESDQAASAAMCASDQDKFWEMHATIFANWNGENQGAYSDRRLTAFAETTGLEMSAFNACFKDKKFKSEIQADFDSGTKIGVQGTPSVFVNGTFITPGYVPSYDEVLKAVEAALAASAE